MHGSCERQIDGENNYNNGREKMQRKTHTRPTNRIGFLCTFLKFSH